jgi:hypothetical protein
MLRYCIFLRLRYLTAEKGEKKTEGHRKKEDSTFLISAFLCENLSVLCSKNYIFAKMFKLIFKLFGWKITGYLPKEIKKCVVVVAPHTSNWDFVFGMGAVGIMKLHPRFVIKKEWMRFPFKKLMRSLGALPIDRNAKNKLGEKKGTVDAMAELFDKHDDLLLIITPEGTRKRVEKWKTGFYYVALKANVPIALGCMNYEKYECGIYKIIHPSGDFKSDMKQIMDFYKDAKPKNPKSFSVDVELSK